MIKEALPPPAVINPAVPANSGLDSERWPSWLREAFAIQPGIKPQTGPRVEPAPTRINPAYVRKLTRMPSR